MKMSARGPHDTKMTTYLTSAELLALDATLLEMRRLYGVKIDRSRFVREALAAASARAIAARVKGDVAPAAAGIHVVSEPQTVAVTKPRRPRRSPNEIPECGTETAYQRHRWFGEPKDDACLHAHAEHERQRAAERRNNQRAAS